MSREDIDALVEALRAVGKAASRIKSASAFDDYVFIKSVGEFTEAARLTSSQVRRAVHEDGPMLSFRYRGVNFLHGAEREEAE